MNSRIQHKIDTSENWAKAENFIPLEGELIIYSDLNRIKIGDGITYVNDLLFISNPSIGEATEEGGEIFNDYENNKADLYGHAEGFKTQAGHTGHAEGDHTEADWRSHAEGYHTHAENTAHAGGRLSIATGKGSLAQGLGRPIDVKVNNVLVKSTENILLTSNIIPLDTDIRSVLQVGDFVYLFLTDAEGNKIIEPTDSKRIEEISEDGKILTLSDCFLASNYNETDVPTPEDGGEPVIPIGAGLRKDVPCQALGEGSIAIGKGVIASGAGSSARGMDTVASGLYSHAEGNGSTASGQTSHAEGRSTTASGVYSHSEGNKSSATVEGAHAEGTNTQANGPYSHSEGHYTKANGQYSHAEGGSTIAEGSFSHAEGYHTHAKGVHQHVQGKYNIIDDYDQYAHIVGNGNANIPSNAYTLDWAGQGWFKKDLKIGGSGYFDDNAKKVVTEDEIKNFASIEDLNGFITEEEISNDYLLKAEAVGLKNNTSEIFNNYSKNKAEGDYSHAEGNATQASNEAAHAEGRETIASGFISHAEGYDTEATGEYSHSEGRKTKATNIAAHAEGNETTASGQSSHAEGYNNTALGLASHAEGYNNEVTGLYAHVEGKENKAWGDNSHAEGHGCKAEGYASHAEGRSTEALNYYTHAEGKGSVANAEGAHAEGQNTSALGKYSHVEGWNSIITAKGEYGHAEGVNTKVDSTSAHAEGYKTEALGPYSHAEGHGTIANGTAQHVQGRWNEPLDGNYLHVVGNGNRTTTTDDQGNTVETITRSNCHTIDKNGNAWFSGKVTAEQPATNKNDLMTYDQSFKFKNFGIANFPLNNNIYEFVYNFLYDDINNRFVLITQSAIYTTQFFDNWEKISSHDSIDGGIYFNGIFIIWKGKGREPFYSTNLIDWQICNNCQPLPYYSSGHNFTVLNNCIYQESHFGGLLISIDGISWESFTPVYADGFEFSNQDIDSWQYSPEFGLVCIENKTFYISQDNGYTWSILTTCDSVPASFCAGKDKIIAIINTDLCFYTQDKGWQMIEPELAMGYNTSLLHYTNDKYFIQLIDYPVWSASYMSNDGINWKLVDVPIDTQSLFYDSQKIIYGNNIYVACVQYGAEGDISCNFVACTQNSDWNNCYVFYKDRKIINNEVKNALSLQNNYGTAAEFEIFKTQNPDAPDGTVYFIYE